VFDIGQISRRDRDYGFVTMSRTGVHSGSYEVGSGSSLSGCKAAGA
jgi:hypothetical protein